MPSAKTQARRHVELLVRCQQDPITTSEEDVKKICEALRKYWADPDSGIADEYAELTDGQDLEQDSVLALAELPPGRIDSFVPDLITHFDSDRQFYECAHALLAAVFPTITVALPATSLTTSQSAVLRSLTANEVIWRRDGDLAEDLEKRGLPGTRERMQEYLASRDV